MDVSSDLLLIVIGLVLPALGENVFVEMCIDDVCRPKCCQTNEYFNSTSKQCQSNVTEAVKSKSGGESVFLCPGGTWHDVAGEKFDSFKAYQCVDLFINGSQVIQKALLCPKIRLTLCCNSFYYYSITNLICEPFSNGKSIGLLPVQSKTNIRTVKVSTENFQVTTDYDMFECPNGTIIQISPDFTLFDDGTLKIPNITSKFNPGNFCITEVHSTDFVALFCVPDPCASFSCIHKCCPRGFLWNAEGRYCERTDLKFSVDYQNENEQRAHLPKNMTIRPGFKNCKNFFYRNEEVLQGDFYILPNGALYVPAYPDGHRVFDDYCVDDFKINNKIVKKALICVNMGPVFYKARVFHFSATIISSIFLIATFVVYAIIPELRNTPGASLMCHVVSTAAAYISLGMWNFNLKFVRDEVPYFPRKICTTLAILFHFSLLASFTWLNVICLDIWIAFSDVPCLCQPKTDQSNRLNVQRRHRIAIRFLVYSLYAWGVPMIFVLLCGFFGNNNSFRDFYIPQFGTLDCWLVDYMSKMTYLHGPIGAILPINILWFILTAVNIYRTGDDVASTPKTRRKKRKALLFFITSTLLMGGTWCPHVFFDDRQTEYGYLTGVFSFLVGVFFFIFFVCKKKVAILLRKRMIDFK